MTRRLLLAVLLAAAVVPYFVNLGATSIIDANEAFYSETPREMLVSGDWINSSFNDEPRFNKPPLSYWVVAGFYEAFGVSLGAARLPIALGLLLILATVFLLGRTAYSTDAGLLAALTLAATPRMLLFSRRIIIDVYTAMFVGLALLCFAMAEREPARRRRWLIALYVAVGLGVMTKGPVAAVLPALVFTVYLTMTGRLHTIRKMMLPLGMLIVAVIVVPYYAALHAQHGWAYISTFVLTENIARFAEGVGAPNRGPLFYLPVVFADLYFPWSLTLLPALLLVPWRTGIQGAGWRRLVGGGDVSTPVPHSRIRMLLGLWVVLIPAFFSMSRAQQDLYVLPFVAAAAPLVGGLVIAWLDGALTASYARVVRGTLGAMAIVLAALGVAGAWLIGGASGPIHLAGAAPAGVLIAIGATAALALLSRRRDWAAVVALAATVIVVHWIIVIWTLPDFERYKPVPQLARVVQTHAGPDAAVGIYKVATPSLVFYLQRRVPQMFDEGQLRDFLAAHAETYIVMTDDDYADVKDRVGVPLRILARAPRFDVQLRHVLTEEPLPSLLLVTTR